MKKEIKFSRNFRFYLILCLIFLLFKSYSFGQLNANKLNKFNVEFHDHDSIVRIGDALYNVVTDEVIGFEFSMDTINNKLEEELSSKWLAIDPKYRKYSFASPYVFALNKVLVFKDIDGEDLVVTGKGAADFTNYITKSFNGQIEAKIVDGIVKLYESGCETPISVENYSMDGYTSQQQALFSTLSKTISTDEKVNIVAEKTGDFTIIGKYSDNRLKDGQMVDVGGRIDISDIEGLDNLEGNQYFSGISAITHEIEEQFQKQVVKDGTKTEHHQHGLEIQGKMDGIKILGQDFRIEPSMGTDGKKKGYNGVAVIHFQVKEVNGDGVEVVVDKYAQLDIEGGTFTKITVTDSLEDLPVNKPSEGSNSGDD